MAGTPLSPPTTPYYGGGQVAHPADTKFGIVTPPVNNAAVTAGIIYADTVTEDVFYSTKPGSWVQLAAGGGSFNTLTGDSGDAAVPVSGNINLLGTTNQIVTTSSSPTGDDVKFALADYVILVSALEVPTIIGSDSGSLKIQLGDNAGASTVFVEDSDGGTVASIDSDGGLIITSGSVTAGDFIVSHSSAGVDVTSEVTNSDNTDPASNAGFEAAVGGTSAGDPYVNFLISGGQAFTMGIDNSSTNDDFVISDASALGTANRFVIDGSTGDTSITGNLILPTSATQLQVKGGGITDSIGNATLTSGAVTVANTSIAATDRIFIQRASANGSSALGMLTYTISAGASFTITSVQAGTPASTETNDISDLYYFIVRQI